MPYEIVYKGKKTAEERLQEQTEEQRVIEIRIKAEQEQQHVQQDHHSPGVSYEDTQENMESISESEVVHHSPASEHQGVEVDQRLQHYIPDDLLQRITSGDSEIGDIDAAMLDMALRISARDQTVPSSGRHGWQQRLSADSQSDEVQHEERARIMPNLANLFRLLMVTRDTDEMMSSTLTERSSSSSSMHSADISSTSGQQQQQLTSTSDSPTLPSNESTRDEQPDTSEEDLELALALSLSLSLNRTNA